MKREYTYRPPLKFLFQMVLGFFSGVMFLSFAIFIPEVWWFKALMIFFSIILFGYFVLFYKRCFSYRRGNKIFIYGQNVTLPFTENGINIRFSFSDIFGIEVYDAHYSEIIQLESNKGILELERIWMKNKQYIEFLQILKSNIKIT